MATASELPVNTSASAVDMANAMFGDGVTVVSASYTGASSASGTFTDGIATSPGVLSMNSGVILSTGRVTDFTQSSGDPNVSGRTTTEHGTAGDADLTAVAGQTTYDAAVLQATFVPTGDTLTMQLVFSSEEYLEYVNGGFNDAVGVWVNGVKIDMTVGTGEIAIDNINNGSNPNLYVDNPKQDDLYNTEMDGFTVTLTLKAPVNVGVNNTIKIGIADAGDEKWDSNLLIKADSMQTSVIAHDDEFDLVSNGSQTVDLRANDTNGGAGALTITHINGAPVVAGSVVTLATGQQITLNPDGTTTILNDGDVGDVDVFTYTIANNAGTSDVAFVTLNTIACFTAGTYVTTARGERLIETLEPGDLILTLDHGPQRLRWIGRRKTIAHGPHAPVEIAADTFGPHAAIRVSQQHRLIFEGERAELLFGERQVLARARDLIDGNAVRLVADGSAVDYIHLLFDRHEIIRANGLPSESFHPGDVTLADMDADVRAEIHDLFPELAAGGDYGPAARISLRVHEARLLRRLH